MKSILVIDDELDILEMLELALTMDGHEVVTAEGGQRAIEIANSRPIDLIICDIKMPGMDGVQTISVLRESVPSTPIIVATGYLAHETIDQCMQLGVKRYLRKPFTIRELGEAMEAVLGAEE